VTDSLELKSLPTKPLTKRQLEVLRLFAEGYHSPQIAQKLYITPHTVIGHKRHIQRKLNTYSLPHSVAEAFRRGYIT
jgi:DNA-binding CsgD family transcriptional regulator